MLLIHLFLFLYKYNSNFDVTILRTIKQERTGIILKPTEDDDRTFWCWWRDMSHYELFDLLSLSFIYSEYEKDAYSDLIFPMFWKKLINMLYFRSQNWILATVFVVYST